MIAESEDSSFDDNYLDNYSTDIDSRTNNSECDSLSQNSAEEEKLMENFEEKMRNFYEFKDTDEGPEVETSEDDVPADAKELMKQMKRRIRTISSHFPPLAKKHHQTPTDFNFNIKWFNDAKRPSKTSVRPPAKTITKPKEEAEGSKKIVPSKEETSFQKADQPLELGLEEQSDLKPSASEQSEGRGLSNQLPQAPQSETSYRGVEQGTSKSVPPDPATVPKAVLEINNEEDCDANLKVVKYLEQLYEAERDIDRRIQLNEEISGSELEAINLSKSAILEEYGYEFPREGKTPGKSTASSISSDDDSDKPMKKEIVSRILKATLGKKASDVDLTDVMKSDKWKRAVEKENSRLDADVKGKLEKRRREFDKIFEGVTKPLKPEEFQNVHEKVSPWVQHQNRKLEKFISSAKYAPGYLLNEWDGRLSDDSDEPDFDKYRDNWQKEKEALEEETPENTPPPSVDNRMPSLQENNGFLFPTPLTKSYGRDERFVQGHAPRPNHKAVMELVANEVKRKRDAEKAKSFLKENWHPPYPFSTNDDKREVAQ